MARAATSVGTGATAALRYFSAVSLLTLGASVRALGVDRHPAPGLEREPLETLLARARTGTPGDRRALAETISQRLEQSGGPIVEDSTVTFVYRGPASRVAVSSDLNGWSASGDPMSRLDDTEFFVLTKTLHRAGRFEYKFIVDSTWMLDPFNPQQAMGGFGPNSEVWMPGYVPPVEILPREEIAHGEIDTLEFQSTILGRTHPVFVYHPPGAAPAAGFPCLVVTDGGEYLALGLMHTILDNLIADGRIRPLMALFIDPRTDINDSRTSTRVHDYAMSDTFVSFLVREFLPRMRSALPLAQTSTQTGIMGCSLGGLIATYAAFRYPETFGFCAAQSPAYWWNNEAMIHLVRESARKDFRPYLDTGTLRDAAPQARAMRAVFDMKGYPCVYAEYPEGHNWVNWRAHIDDILFSFLAAGQ